MTDRYDDENSRQRHGIAPSRSPEPIFQRDASPGKRLPRGEKRDDLRRKKYEAILDRMWKEKRTLKDVCTDSDFPTRTSWYKFVESHPDFSEKVKKIHHGLPYAVQITCLDISPRYRIDCERLSARGMGMRHITWGYYVKERPEFAGKARKIHYSLPYAVQIRIHDISPRFRVDCERLRARGFTLPLIARALGVNYRVVQKTLENYNREMGLSSYRPFKKWPREYYEKILERMWKEKRPLKDVCMDPDLPGIGAWERFVEKHPELLERAGKIHYGFPYALQFKHYDVSPRFRMDCERLRARGVVTKSIADALGVGLLSVLKTLKGYNEKMGPVRKYFTR